MKTCNCPHCKTSQTLQNLENQIRSYEDVILTHQEAQELSNYINYLINENFALECDKASEEGWGND